MTDPPLHLADGLRLAGLSYADLWTRYLALGGAGSLDQLCDHMNSADCPDEHEHNIIAQALNDVFVDEGRDHPVAYRHLYGDPEHRSNE